jgi:hypothetical protein
MNFKLLLSAIILFILINGCSSISVSSDYDIYADFAKYSTFYIYKGELKGSKLENAPLVKKRVLDAIESELKKKEFTETDSVIADLTVFALANTADKVNVSSYGYGYGYGWGPYPYGRNIDVTYYTQGSLIIDFVDNKKDELIWRGIGTAVLKDRGTPDERKQFINEAVSKILDQYPPN